MTSQTHTTIKQFVRFDFYTPGDGSDGTGRIRTISPQTDVIEACGRLLMRSGSVEITSNA